MFSALRSIGAGFAKDEGGGVLITFGFAILMLTIATGVAVDFGRMHHAQTQLAGAADAAALAGGRNLLDGRLSDAEVEAIALATFRANLENSQTDFGTQQDPNIVINRQTGEVRVDAAADIPMTISAITGITDRPVKAAATVNARGSDLEVALAIDVTRSMADLNKLGDLKNATAEFFDIILPASGAPNERRIALAPFSSGVNAGPLADDLLEAGGDSDCTFERDDGDNEPTKDSVPERGALNKLITFIKNLLSGGYQQTNQSGPTNATCPQVAVQPLTDDKDLLLSEVNSYYAQGNTAGHLGAQWASYLLSPNWSSILGSGSEPAPYNDGETIKVAVIMTDGNNNTFGGISGGDFSPEAKQSDQRMIQFCKAMRSKNRNIQVYTIGFQLDDSDARQVLRECAGSDANALFAEDGGQLADAYREIARRISKLRLTS